MDTFSDVIVPLDLGGPGDAVLRVAAGLAHRAHVGLRLVTVAPPSLEHTAEDAKLQALAERIEAPWVGTQVIESHDVVSALLDTAGPDGLLCLETRARGPVAAGLLGSTASALLQRTERAVVLVGPRTEPGIPLGLVEVCIDGSDAASALLPVAVRVGGELNLRLRFVQVWHPSQEPLYTHNEAQEEIEAHAARAREEFGVPAEAELLIGLNAARAIVDDAARHRSSIIAVALRRRSQLRRRTLGSVALAVAHAATASVLVVPVPSDS